jgi:hypothetical protein
VISGNLSLEGKSSTITGTTFINKTTTAIIAKIITIVGYIIAHLILLFNLAKLSSSLAIFCKTSGKFHIVSADLTNAISEDEKK